MDELTSRVGSVDRPAALKALLTWVNLGVLKEDTENTFRLLESAEEPTLGARDSSRARMSTLYHTSHKLIAHCAYFSF